MMEQRGRVEQAGSALALRFTEAKGTRMEKELVLLFIYYT